MSSVFPLLSTASPLAGLQMPTIQLLEEAPQINLVDLPPVRRLGEALLSTWNKPSSLIDFGHVALVPVPGGLAIRLGGAGLPLEALIRQIPNVHFRPSSINFEGFKRELVVPQSDFEALIASAGLPADFKETLKKASPLFENYLIHTAFKLYPKKEFRPTHTIALTLARLDEKQYNGISGFTNVYAEVEQNTNLQIPFVDGHDEGLSIWFEERTSPDFIALLKKTFRLTVQEGELTKIFEVPGQRREIHYQNVARIDRDDVEDFLVRMGFNDTQNVKNLDSNLTPALGEVLQHLRALGKFHRYQPVVVQDDPIASIERSLAAIIRQTGGSTITPFVTLHPIRGLLIRLPEDSALNMYSKRLIDYLGFGSVPILYEKGGITYVHEVTVPVDKIEKFLKKPLHLDGMAKSLPATVAHWGNQIGNLWAERENVVEPDGSQKGETRVLATASRRLFALKDRAALEAIRGYTPIGKPEESLPLPRLDCSSNKLTIYFPKILADAPSHWLDPALNLLSLVQAPVEDPETQVLRERMGDLLGTPVLACSQRFEGDRHLYTSMAEVTYDPDTGDNKILELFERGLGMRYLPSHTARPYDSNIPTSGRITCWNELLFGFEEELDIPFLPHGKVNEEGLRLKAPRIVLPDHLEAYTTKEIAEEFEAILKKGGVGRVDVYRDKFQFLLFDQIRNPGIDLTKEALLVALRHFVFELRQNKVPLEIKVQSVLSIAETARNCLPGTHVRVVEETKRVAGQEENIRSILPSFFEQFKDNALTEVLVDFPEGVHAFSYAQDHYGAQFGLDEEAGRRDPNRDRIGARAFQDGVRRDKFLKILNDPQRVIKAMTDLVSSRVDEHGAIQNLSLYRDVLREILTRKGYDDTSLEKEIEKLLPCDEVGYQIKISEEAMKLLLIEIGILNP